MAPSSKHENPVLGAASNRVSLPFYKTSFHHILIPRAHKL